ncbi:GTPase HflX [Planctomycetes bacterium Pla163]|uniref:GTPase HflX n=1 Tax=Rohdeia mirabilis TaxID=2528008 RepID=A0A518D2X8_9BACT|nr:GTPase HflX [Planctomycetes bacterium Pla163]
MSKDTFETKRPTERVLLCGVVLPDQVVDDAGPLTEAAGLVVAAGSEVIGGDPLVHGVVQNRAKPVSATLFGSGKVEEIAAACKALEPDAVVVDNDLTPAQGRNLEKAWCVRVVDRSELILDIFARRAQTKQARLQVELAQTEYLMPRLRRMWTHLERLEGAIGTRGPGETQLETDRRLIKKRILDLKRELSEIERRRRRQTRSRSEQFTIGLVGYTNAGKSTLLNRLTGADVLAEDMLFATLDTRTRRWTLKDGRTVLLSDTVGFLKRLPHHLVASFHATLEEAVGVDLLLHVVDSSHPDARSQMHAVRDVLKREVHVHCPQLLVLNKADALADPVRVPTFDLDGEEDVVVVSARSGLGLDDLDARVSEQLDRRCAKVRLTIPNSEGRLIARVKQAVVVEEERWETDRVELVARVPDRELGNIEREAAGKIRVEVLEQALEPYARLDD